jgi:hypothetical protein
MPRVHCVSLSKHVEYHFYPPLWGRESYLTTTPAVLLLLDHSKLDFSNVSHFNGSHYSVWTIVDQSKRFNFPQLLQTGYFHKSFTQIPVQSNGLSLLFSQKSLKQIPVQSNGPSPSWYHFYQNPFRIIFLIQLFFKFLWEYQDGVN